MTLVRPVCRDRKTDPIHPGRTSADRYGDDRELFRQPVAGVLAALPGPHLLAGYRLRNTLFDQLASNQTDLVIMRTPTDEPDPDATPFAESPLVILDLEGAPIQCRPGLATCKGGRLPPVARACFDFLMGEDAAHVMQPGSLR